MRDFKGFMFGEAKLVYASFVARQRGFQSFFKTGHSEAG